jgi:hypothetical protein
MGKRGVQVSRSRGSLTSLLMLHQRRIHLGPATRHRSQALFGSQTNFYLFYLMLRLPQTAKATAR